MRGTMLGLVLVSIPLSVMGAEPRDVQEREAVHLIADAGASRAAGYLSRSETQYLSAMAIVEKLSGPQSPDLTPVLNGLAELYFDWGRYTEAEALSRRSAAVVEAGLGPAHPLMATALQNLAAIYYMQGEYAKAEPLYRRALAIREATLGPDHPFVAVTLANYAALLRKTSHKREAALAEARSRAILERAAFSSPGPSASAGQ